MGTLSPCALRQAAHDAEIAAAMELEEQEAELSGSESAPLSHMGSEDETDSDEDEDLKMFKNALKTAGKTTHGFFNELDILPVGSDWDSVMWEASGSKGTTVVARAGAAYMRMTVERTEDIGLPTDMPMGSRIVKREIIGADGAVTLRYRAYLNHPLARASAASWTRSRRNPPSSISSESEREEHVRTRRRRRSARARYPHHYCGGQSSNPRKSRRRKLRSNRCAARAVSHRLAARRPRMRASSGSVRRT